MHPLMAYALPKGDCTNPTPHTDLRHCELRGADLKNRNLEGVDLRGVELYQTKLQGANLTNALFHGRMITYAELDGVAGLPTEALALLNKQYLATFAPPKGYSLKPLPKDYSGSNISVAGLDNINLAKKIPGTQTTVALLSYPKYGDSQFALILARYDNDSFDFPACYQGVDPFNDGKGYYYGHSELLDVRPLSSGGYLIGTLTQGSDGDEMGMSEWFKLVILELDAKCRLSILHQEYTSRGGDAVLRNGEYVTEMCGGEPNFSFVDDQTVEIRTTFPVSSKQVCGALAVPKQNVIKKKIKLNRH
jgi:hypothetical protein